MPLMKSQLSVIYLWLFILLLAGCSESPSPEASAPAKQVIQLRFGHAMSTDSPEHAAALIFADQLAKASQGQIQVDIHPNQSLGTNRQMIAQAQRGELDIFLAPTAKLSHIVPSIQLIDMPFLLPDHASAYQVLDGKVGMTLLQQLQSHQLKGLGFWESGFKHLTSNQPINSPADFDQQRFGIMSSKLLEAQFGAWGAQAIIIDFAKLRQALKNNDVEGQENPLGGIVDKKLYEVQKHLYLTRHGYLARVLGMSQTRFNQLSKAHQQMVVTIAAQVTIEQRQLARQRDRQYLDFVKNQSIVIHKPTDPVLAWMRAGATRLLERYRLQFGTELVASIQQTVDEHRQFSEDQLVIAIDADMSGNSALSGLAIRRGIELAIDEINHSGGLLGKSLVVTARDNSMIPARGLDNLARFNQLDNLLAVFSGISSPVVLAELDYIHQHKLLMLDPWAAATPIVDNGHDPNFVFRVSVRDQFAADFLLRNALDVSDKVGLLLVDNGWGRSNHKALVASLENRGLQPAHTEWFEWGKKDFVGTLNNLREAGSEVLIYVGNPVEAVQMIDAHSKTANPVPIISHWGITGGYFPVMAAEALKTVDLRILQTFSFIDNQKPNVQAFVERYKHKYGITATSQIVAPVGTAHAYDLTHLLAKAVTKAGSSDPDKVRQALETLKVHQGLVKSYNPPFTPDNHDALTGDDFILTRYKDNYLIPIHHQ